MKMRSHLIDLIQHASQPNIFLDLKAASLQKEPEPEPNFWSALTLPALSTTLAFLGRPLGLPIPPLIIGSTIAVATLPVAQRALDSILNEKKLNIDFLDLMAISIMTLQGHFISPAIIRVSVPTTVLAALTAAARKGILIRSGRALEKLAEVDAVVFDKTGTLTQGEPAVLWVETVSATSKLRVIELAAAAE